MELHIEDEIRPLATGQPAIDLALYAFLSREDQSQANAGTTIESLPPAHSSSRLIIIMAMLFVVLTYSLHYSPLANVDRTFFYLPRSTCYGKLLPFLNINTKKS